MFEEAGGRRCGTTSGSCSTTTCRGWSARSWRAELADEGPALLRARRRAVHPVRVRRRGVPLRPQPDPPPLPRQRGERRAGDVPRPDGLRPRAARARDRLVADVRPSRPAAGAAREAHGRAPAREPDQPAGADHGRRRRRGLPLARRARPPARPGDRAAVRRGGRAQARRRAPRPGRHRPREPRLARRDAALVLHPARGRRRRRRRPARARSAAGSSARCSSGC